MSSSTASSSSGTSSTQCSAVGVVGSVTRRRPRGASRSVWTYARPSRPMCMAVLASTPTCTSTRAGASSGDAVRSAIHRSLRGSVPSELEMSSQRPSMLTETPK